MRFLLNDCANGFRVTNKAFLRCFSNNRKLTGLYMFNSSKGCIHTLAMFAALGVAGGAVAAPYGLEDNFNGEAVTGEFYSDTSSFFLSSEATDAPSEDTWLTGGFSWTDTSLDFSTLTGVTDITISYSVFGVSAGSTLSLNGTEIDGNLSSQFQIPEGGFYQYVYQNTVSLVGAELDAFLAGLTDDYLTLDFNIGGATDQWALDFINLDVLYSSVDPTDPGTPTDISEPVSLSLFGLGLAALGFSRRRRSV